MKELCRAVHTITESLNGGDLFPHPLRHSDFECRSSRQNRLRTTEIDPIVL